MQSVIQDLFSTGTVVTACLAPAVLQKFEPVVRRLLSGSQLFVKQPDGSYRPTGTHFGLPRYFEFGDLQEPAVRDARSLRGMRVTTGSR
jgi:hypothetical protein